MRYRIRRKRGANMPTTATLTKQKGKKKPDIKATSSLLRDRLAMAKIRQGRKEARMGKTCSWDDVFGD